MPLFLELSKKLLVNSAYRMLQKSVTTSYCSPGARCREITALAAGCDKNAKFHGREKCAIKCKFFSNPEFTKTF